MRAEPTLVKLHAFKQFNFGLKALAFFNGDHAVLANFVHGVGNDLANVHVLIGGAATNLRDLLGVLHWLAHFLKLVGDGANRGVNAALDRVHICAGGDVLQAFLKDGFRVDGCGCGAVASVFAGFVGHFLHHLRAHVFIGIFKFNFLGDSHAVFGDGWRAETFLKHNNAASWTKSDLHGLGQLLHAAKNSFTRVIFVCNLFCSHFLFL